MRLRLQRQHAAHGKWLLEHVDAEGLVELLVEPPLRLKMEVLLAKELVELVRIFGVGTGALDEPVEILKERRDVAPDRLANGREHGDRKASGR